MECQPLVTLPFQCHFLGRGTQAQEPKIEFLLITFIGAKFQKINNYSILLSSTSFFVISNFGVWLIGYPKNLEGFILCYYMALPFFINTILGDLFYCYAMKYSLVYAINKKIILR